MIGIARKRPTGSRVRLPPETTMIMNWTLFRPDTGRLDG